MTSESFKEPIHYKSKSIEKQSIVKGYYRGLWTEYILNIVFDDLSCSNKIEMDYPIHGVSRNCNVLVSETGFVFIL